MYSIEIKIRIMSVQLSQRIVFIYFSSAVFIVRMVQVSRTFFLNFTYNSMTRSTRPERFQRFQNNPRIYLKFESKPASVTSITRDIYIQCIVHV